MVMAEAPTWAANDPVMARYFHNEWGRPVHGEAGVFERLCLEVFQSGLSWLTILKKRKAFRAAFSGFDPEAVAAFEDLDVERLLSDAAIVRNRRKIEAAVTNAQATLGLRADGGFSALVWSYEADQKVVLDEQLQLPTRSVESTALAKDLKSRGFTFVGPTNMYALMCAIGIVDVRTALGLDG